MAQKPQGGQIKSPEQYKAERQAARARKQKNAGHGNKRSPKPTVQPKVVVSEVARATKQHQRLVTTRSKQSDIMQRLMLEEFINLQGRCINPLLSGSTAEQIVAKAIELFREGKNGCINEAIAALKINSRQSVISLARHFFRDLTDVSWEILRQERANHRQAELELAYS